MNIGPRSLPPDRILGLLRQEGDCLVFTGPCDRKGYGRLRIGGRNTYAHRLAYELAYEEPPAHLVVMHRCDNPPCCNPDHLQLGTAGDNNRDRHAKGRTRIPSKEAAGWYRNRTHCKNGHPWDAANTATFAKTGARRCRACNRANAARQFAKRQASANAKARLVQQETEGASA